MSAQLAPQAEAQTDTSEIRLQLESLNTLVRLALGQWFGCSGGIVIAQMLASLYDGDRVKANLFRLGVVDSFAIEHLLRVIRLHACGRQEIHTFFDPGAPLHTPKMGANGNAIFERLISEYGFDKRRGKL